MMYGGRVVDAAVATRVVDAAVATRVMDGGRVMDGAGSAQPRGDQERGSNEDKFIHDALSPFLRSYS
jgi:hypothetical protein